MVQWVGTFPAWLTVVLSASLLASGCTANVNCQVEQGGGGQKTICNGTVFTYTLQGTPPGTADSYQWQNDKGSAQVSAVFQGSGSASVTIKDSAGTQVYSRTHSGSGQTAESKTTTGAKGAWTISIQVTSLSGQVVVSVTPASP
ncbi:MAG: hypothetical protein HYT80_04435 [Euryarchaeota archaeon]|nr:hypothetical protein [Euryarchaeota archaeon]